MVTDYDNFDEELVMLDIILSSPINTVVALFVAIYGISHAVKNWTLRILNVLFWGMPLRQAEYGKVLDAAWLVGVGYLVYILI